MVGTLIVILQSTVEDPVWEKKIVQIVLGLLHLIVSVWRKSGVHYPSDVLASLCVGLSPVY